MTPLHRRAEDALTQLAWCDARLAQGVCDPGTVARLRAAREECEAIMREAGVIPRGQVREHWLDQQKPPGIACLDTFRKQRQEEWR